MKGALGIGQDRGELAFGEAALFEMLVKGGILFEFHAWVFLRIQNTDRQAKLFLNDAHRHHEVGIAADDDGTIKAAEMGVVEELGTQVDVRAFFLRFDDDCPFRSTRCRIGQRHFDILREEETVEDFKIRERPQGPQVSFLTNRLKWVVGALIELRREILGADDYIPRAQVLADGLHQIEPFVAGAFDSSEVEVETVDVNHRLHPAPPSGNKQGPAPKD